METQCESLAGQCVVESPFRPRHFASAVSTRRTMGSHSKIGSNRSPEIRWGEPPRGPMTRIFGLPAEGRESQGDRVLPQHEPARARSGRSDGAGGHSVPAARRGRTAPRGRDAGVSAACRVETGPAGEDRPTEPLRQGGTPSVCPPRYGAVGRCPPCRGEITGAFWVERACAIGRFAPCWRP